MKKALFAMFIIALVLVTGCSNKTTENTNITETQSNAEISNIEHTVIINEAGMQPSEITINKGDIVVFISNKNDTIVLGEDLFSFNLKQDQKTSYTFDETGEFKLIIDNHHMASVIVN